ncbi:MAG: hypothetical protein ACI8P9_003839 [Parasphingorhabdus sp.]|jgi:uncharacterized protein (DUF2132 family)
MTRDPLHGITLIEIVTTLVKHYGLDVPGQRINIKCFTHDPNINRACGSNHYPTDLYR